MSDITGQDDPDSTDTDVTRKPGGLGQDGTIPPDPDGVADRVRDRRRDRVVGGLAHRLRAVGSEVVAGLGEVDLRDGDVGHLRHPVGPEHRVEHRSVVA